MARKIPNIVKQIQNYTYPEIDYRYQSSVSFSQLGTYMSCPHKWQLQYKENTGLFDYNIHMIFGSALHEVLQDYITKIYEESGAAADRMDLEQLFKQRFFHHYKENKKRNNGNDFSDAAEMREFFNDGMDIINFVKKKKGSYFSRKGWYLVGVEIPILTKPNSFFQNMYFKGYLDLVLYHEPTNTFTIYDIKTSTSGWNKWKKKDDKKNFQLILYRSYFAKQFGIPEEDIKVEFFIVKRKINEEADYARMRQRVQIHSPIQGSGRNKTNKALKTLNDFISECFSLDGKIKDTEHMKFTGKQCEWCIFHEKNICKK